jgi:hypothetical protein
MHTVCRILCRPSCAVPALVVVPVIGAVVVTVTTSTAQGLRVTISSTTSAPFPMQLCAMSPHIALDSAHQSPHFHHFASNLVQRVGVVTLTPCQRSSKPCNSSDKIQGFSSLTMKNCAFCMKHATNSGLFALFWRTSGGYTMPEGYYVNQGAGGVTPKNIRREQKVTFSGCA